jgi:pimeloyl-ACP methyl ester carboxylesterase
MSRVKKIALASSLSLSALLFLGAVIIARGIELPTPTGPYSIGRAVFRWTDPSRPEVMTDSSTDHRELVVYLWYAAEPTSGGSTVAYFPDLDALKGVFTPIELLGVSSVRTHAVADAPISSAKPKYPIIVFSHGNRANSAFHTAQIEDLASHGYVVAAIDHPYDALGVVLSNGEVATFAEDKWSVPGSSSGPAIEEPSAAQFYRGRVETRASDAVFVLDKLAQLAAEAGSQFGSRLDLERVGIFGHSIGGVAAGRACQVDSRFKACLNLDGLAAGQPFYPDEAGNGPAQPYMLMLKPLPVPSDAQLAAWKTTREAWTALQRDRVDALLTRVASGSYKLTARGFNHQSFSDNPLMYPSLPESLAAMSLRAEASGYRQVQLTREYTLAFFDKHVTSNGSTLLDQPSTTHPEMSLETYGEQKLR